MTLFVLLTLPVHSHAASSSPIPYTKIYDALYDTDDIHNGISGVSSSADINAISYLSDGEKLSGTIWMHSPLKNNSSALIWIDIDIYQEIEYDSGLDYRYSLFQNDHGNWIGKFEEHFGTRSNTIFFDNNDEFNPINDTGDAINFSIDLKQIGFPEKYRMSILVFTDSVSFFDLMHWVEIPSPNFELKIIPNSIELTKGETTTIQIDLQSDSRMPYGIELSTEIEKRNIMSSEYSDFPIHDLQLEKNLKLNFDNEELIIRPNGKVSTFLYIEALENANKNIYDFPIYAKLQIPQQEIFEKISIIHNVTTERLHEQNFLYSISSNPIYTYSNLSIKLKDSDTLEDKIYEFFKIWGTPLNIAFGVLLGGSGAWFWRKMKNRKLNQDQK